MADSVDHVVLYTSCHPQDKTARSVLREHDIPFTEHNDHEYSPPKVFYQGQSYKGIGEIDFLAESIAEFRTRKP